eukprot:CAMPEP_0116138952 /NCGR_PEP_ID=MMETSP0329-20121206/13046_1 /TAXON_ID=697910 /ORGANISM="Pseudo-nitzschia arenysensis, Strain B593" /LENGTH=105 /DNA_ID=CAMNT_0003633949 /DNA_START=1 /DNA_END=318 /DNA_ORIENTATION=+
MELLPLNPPSEKDIRCRLEQLDLNRTIPIEVVGEEPNEYLTMGGKKGSIKGPQKCNKCGQLRKGHLCPFDPRKRKTIETQTDEETFLKRLKQKTENSVQSKDIEE